MRFTLSFAILALVPGLAFAATPPLPSGAHPRLFMSTAEQAGYAAKAQVSSSNVSAVIAACQRTIDHPSDYTGRGGVDSDTWPAAAVKCAFAYTVTQNSQYLSQAIMFWQTALNDDQTMGDGKACVDGVSTDWQSWASGGESGASPPILLTIVHDTGYPMRWYGPDLALTYDWLYNAPGVTDALRAQTRTCFTAWFDFYTKYGYDRDKPGANYQAGFTAGKALAAIAIGNDGGADGHIWTEVVNDQFGSLIVGQGLAGSSAAVGMPAGPLVGGDSLEGWQYGNLTVLEYAVASRALADNGATWPEIAPWADGLLRRFVYGLVPQRDGLWVGGDFDSTATFPKPAIGAIEAALIAPGASDQTVAAALFEWKNLSLSAGDNVYGVIAEQRDTVTPQDFRTQSPAPSLSYLARGTRTMYFRSGFDNGAFWGAFMSAPYLVGHEHFAASNFAFSHGADHLIVDSSQYGAPGTLETNAVSVDSPGVPGSYGQSQTPWSTADLPWARAADGNVVAARSDFAHGFDYNGTPSDVPYAHREWAFLPEGEMVAIDRAVTKDAAHVMYVNFHANTGRTLKLNGGVAQGTVGGSGVVIHPVLISGGSPGITAPGGVSDSSNCSGSYPSGNCTNARFAVDIYALKVPGPAATAVHVIDGLNAGEDPAVVASLNDPSYDPSAQNGGVIGAAVYRAMKQSYVVASSAPRGNAGAMLSYGVPGTPARHVVFDAPEAADGSSTVAAAAQGGRCVITITAGSGGGLTGHPLMFRVDSADNGCTVADGGNTPMAGAPPTPTPIHFAGGEVSGGCSCGLSPGTPVSIALPIAGAAGLLLRRLRRRPRRSSRG
jgi:hypothetical protein